MAFDLLYKLKVKYLAKLIPSKNFLFVYTVNLLKSGEPLSDCPTCSATHFRNVLPSESVLILDLHLVDLVSPDVLALQCVHEVDLHWVVAALRVSYVWMMAQPPVWMYYSATPFTSPLSLSLMKPGGSTWRAAGDLFWMTTTELRSFVMILEKPEKSWTMVSGWECGYGRVFWGWVRFVSFWPRSRRRAALSAAWKS